MTGYENNSQISLVITTKKEKEIDEFFAWHKPWMQSTHGPMGLLLYTVVKSAALSNPVDPKSVVEGSYTYVVTEIYATPEGAKKHWAMAPKELGKRFDDLMAILTDKEATCQIVHAGKIVNGLNSGDLAFPITLEEEETKAEEKK
jgi:hypothetical protein